MSSTWVPQLLVCMLVIVALRAADDPPRDFILSIEREVDRSTYYSRDPGVKKVQIYSLDPNNPVPSCLRSMPDFPQNDTGACASIGPDNIPVCCGGYWSGPEQFHCYRLDPATRKWVQEKDAYFEIRANAYIRHSTLGLVTFSGDALHNKVQAIGGSPSASDGLNIRLLQDLPGRGSYRHCALELSNGDIFAIPSFGKFIGQEIRGPWLYSVTSGNWVPKEASGMTRRYRFACGVVKNKYTGKEEVVVAGGSCEANRDCCRSPNECPERNTRFSDYWDVNRGGVMISSDIYSVEDDTWRAGPDVPGIAMNFQGLPYDEHSFLIKVWNYPDAPNGHMHSATFYKYDQDKRGWTSTGVSDAFGNTVNAWVDSSIFPDCSISQTERYKNLGEDCGRGRCKRQGFCSWCGTEGRCCRKGYLGGGCEMQMGGENNHICVKDPAYN